MYVLRHRPVDVFRKAKGANKIIKHFYNENLRFHRFRYEYSRETLGYWKSNEKYQRGTHNDKIKIQKEGENTEFN